jgi:hypothetical protein
MDIGRRAVVAGMGAALFAPGVAAMNADFAFDPIPAPPATPPTGHPGDFAFLTGEWRIHNRSIVDGAWLEYEGEATVHAILDGVGSVEELRIPARDFSGMGLRLLDREKRVWVDHWVNARSGVMTLPGQIGGFENGVGLFISEDTVDGARMLYAGVWDQITPTTCRWRQAMSADGGAWEQTWIMQWRRVTASPLA